MPRTWNPYMKQLLTAHSDKLALMVASCIVVLSLLPPSDVQQIAGSDKLIHFIAYAVLAVFALYRRQSWVSAMVVVTGILMLGGLIELVQPGFHRTSELLDFGADLAGLCFGAALVATARLTWANIHFPMPGERIAPAITAVIVRT